jgi:hypothetical protein
VYLRLLAGVLAGTVAASAIARPVPVDDVTFSGLIEQFTINGRFGKSLKTRDRFTRIAIAAETGKWEFKGTYWYYPFWGWYDLDETHISYREDNFSWRIGRFMPAIGLTDWEDQWYSGFNFLPLTQMSTFSGRKLGYRTVPGTEFSYQYGNEQIKASLTSSQMEQGRFLASRFDRASLRYTWYQNGLTLGASGLMDLSNHGSTEQMLAADARYTTGHWIFRGEYRTYLSPTRKVQGGYVDGTFRFPGAANFTLVGRAEVFRSQGTPKSSVIGYTLGAKARLPFDFVIYLNYSFGPDMNRIFLGQGWSIALNRSFRF